MHWGISEVFGEWYIGKNGNNEISAEALVVIQACIFMTWSTEIAVAIGRGKRFGQ